MKKLIILLFISFFAISASESIAQDAKAGAVLDAMSAKYKSLKGFKADFSYGVVSNGKAGRVQKGSIAVKGVKFKLNMVGQEIYNNGSDIYAYVKETNEVNVTEYDASNDGEFSPANIYSIYKKGYKYTYKGAKNIGGVAHDVVELVPNKKGNVEKIELTVDKASKTIKSWKLYSSPTKYTQFNVLTFTPNSGLADSYFTFNKASHPGVEVVDLR